MGKTASAFFIFVFFGGILTGLHYGLYYLLSRQGRLNVSTIQVEGNRFLSGTEVVEATMLPEGINIFDINLKQAEDNIRKNYLVEDAVIMLYPPDRILIKVSERAPVAVIVDKAKNAFLCDRNGRILQKSSATGFSFIFINNTIGNEMCVSDKVVLLLLMNLSRFERKNEIERIKVDKKDGILMTVKGLEDTVFSSGKTIPDSDLFNKMLGIASGIKMKGLRIKYIDISNDSAIGYE